MAQTADPISVTIANAGTRQQATATEYLVNSFLARARSGNAGIVYLGDSDVSSADGFPLGPGESATISATGVEGTIDLKSFYADAATSGDKMDISALRMVPVLSGVAGVTHDIAVRPPGYGAEFGLMLLRGDEGQVRFERRNRSLIPGSAPQAAAGPLTLPPEIRFVYHISGAELGIGQKRHAEGNKRIGLVDGVDTRFGGFIAGPDPTYSTALTGPGGDFAQMGGDLYVLDENKAYKLNTSTGNFDAQDTGPTANSGALMLHDDRLYRGYGAGVDWEHSTNGSTWTASGLVGDDADADRFAVTFSANGVPVLWKSLKPNKLANSTTPRTANSWAVWRIGDSDSNIVDLVVIENLLIILKEDGVWIIDENSQPRNITPQWRHSRTARQGFGASAWGNALYVPAGRNSMWELVLGEGLRRNIGPSSQMDEFVEYSGKVTRVIGDSDWLYAFVQDPTNSSLNRVHIMVARPLNLGDLSAFPWSHLATLDKVGRVDGAWILNISAVEPRLYWSGRAQDDGNLDTNNIGYITLPKQANPRRSQPGDYIFKSQVTARTGILQRFPGWKTAFQELEIVSSEDSGESLGTQGRKIVARYDIFDGAGFVEVGGGAGSFETSPRETRYFKSSGVAAVVADRIELELQLWHDSSQQTPVIEEINLFATVRPDSVDIFQFTVLAEENVHGLGGRTNTPRADIIAAINAMTTPGWTTTLFDRDSNPHEVYLLTDGGLVDRDHISYPDGPDAKPKVTKVFDLVCFEVPNSSSWPVS